MIVMINMYLLSAYCVLATLLIFHYLMYVPQQSHEVDLDGAIITPHLQMRKPLFRKIKQLSEGHTAGTHT